jgi:hypothetical protein
VPGVSLTGTNCGLDSASPRTCNRTNQPPDNATRGHKVTGSRLHLLSASLGPRGHCASGPGRGIHRRTSGRRGSDPRPSWPPTPGPTTGRGTSDNPGTVRVGPGRRQPPPNPRALNRRSLRPLMLRHVRCFSCRSITRFSAKKSRSAAENFPSAGSVLRLLLAPHARAPAVSAERKSVDIAMPRRGDR